MLFLLCVAASLTYTARADPITFGLANSLPPYGLPVAAPLPVWASKEVEKEAEAAKELELEKIFPWLAFDKGVEAGLFKGVEKKELGFEKGIAMPYWGMASGSMERETELEKLFGIGKVMMAFEQALMLELYKLYGPYGIWIVRELERRYAIAKELGLIGKEIKLEEAITLGLFKGLGLDKHFTAAKEAIAGKEIGLSIGKGFAFQKGMGFKLY